MDYRKAMDIATSIGSDKVSKTLESIINNKEFKGLMGVSRTSKEFGEVATKDTMEALAKIAESFDNDECEGCDNEHGETLVMREVVNFREAMQFLYSGEIMITKIDNSIDFHIIKFDDNFSSIQLLNSKGEFLTNIGISSIQNMESYAFVINGGVADVVKEYEESLYSDCESMESDFSESYRELVTNNTYKIGNDVRWNHATVLSQLVSGGWVIVNKYDEEINLFVFDAETFCLNLYTNIDDDNNGVVTMQLDDFKDIDDLGDWSLVGFFDDVGDRGVHALMHYIR